jgi:hypothetical protein
MANFNSPVVYTNTKTPASELPAEVQRYAPPSRSAERQDNSENFSKRAPALSSATDLHRLLEKRSRQLGAAIGVLEQQRQHLRSVEKQREINSKEFAGSVDNFKETARQLKEATAHGGQPSDVERHSESNRKALEQLESSVVAMVTNFHYWRATWDQYQQTCTRTKELKLEMAASEPLIDA